MKKRKLNRLLLLILAFTFSMLLMSAQAFAAPDSLPADIESTATELITLKAPDTESLSTTNKCLPVSATAPQGAVVSLYKYNAASDTYNKVYVDETPMETTVGATMLYASQVELTQGVNKFLIRSELNEATYQVVKFEVNLLNEGFMDKIKSIAGMIFN